MKKKSFFLWLALWLIPLCIMAQEEPRFDPLQFQAVPEPIEVGLRYDDNVFRSVSLDERLPDEVYSLNLGGEASQSYGIFKGDLEYHMGAEQYQLYSILNNLINDFNLSISIDPVEWSFSYKKEF